MYFVCWDVCMLVIDVVEIMNFLFFVCVGGY